MPESTVVVFMSDPTTDKPAEEKLILEIKMPDGNFKKSEKSLPYHWIQLTAAEASRLADSLYDALNSLGYI